MPTRTIDLRSDTVTKPTPGMRRAMADAEVGDDVLGDDPTIIRLQERIAHLMGKEAACFVPSGTMANQTAIRSLTEPGDEIIAHQDSHFFHYETAGFAAIAGCAMSPIPGERGQFEPEAIDARVRPGNSHFAHTALVVIENTHNRGGGSVWPLDKVEAVTQRARKHGLKCHLDGARLWNACTATGESPAAFARHFDTVSTCFSKGLGAPAGSAVAGNKEIIARVHRFRKMLGGAMRQSGILAAAAVYALDHHVERLADDHANARRLAEALADMQGITIDPAGVESNILYFDVDRSHGSGADFCRRMESFGVRMLATGPQRIRAVTHLDVSAEQVDAAIEIIAKLTGAPVPAA